MSNPIQLPSPDLIAKMKETILKVNRMTTNDGGVNGGRATYYHGIVSSPLTAPTWPQQATFQVQVWEKNGTASPIVLAARQPTTTTIQAVSYDPDLDLGIGAYVILQLICGDFIPIYQGCTDDPTRLAS